MLKKLLIAFIGVAMLIGTIVYIKLGQFSAMEEATANMAMPPTVVTAQTVNEAQWEEIIPATGSVSALQGVTVSAEEGGRITRILFESSDDVKAGQVLIQLDTASEKSQLASAIAAEELARNELSRQKKLLKKNMTSDEALDRAEAQLKDSAAQVGVIKALIDKKTVRAPFSGRLGIRQVDLGQIVSVGDPIVTLQSLDPMYVDFSVPQQKLSLLKNDMDVRIKSDAHPDTIFRGKIAHIDLGIDPVTRNVQVQALVGNPDEELRVGMFVNVELVLPKERTVLPVPATAVLYASFGNSVFVIDEQKNEESGEKGLVLRQQFVTLGLARGDYIDVTDGLKAGETIATSGVFKLATGTKVVIDNTLAPKTLLDPKPSDS
ncbi:MAG: efflux RND transporter periplasmic adaptor subunit [Gammaproteobacteria bacterium]|nr:efflux RND transporter periplasmic adaptor subunit [Gammaproteobacteria bacterium]